MLKESTTMRTGNDRYEGFAIDIIQELSKILHFNYTFVEQVDKDYGNPIGNTGKWSGMLGKIMDGVRFIIEDCSCSMLMNFSPFQEADLAICDLTITAAREKVVDFTMPFMNLGEFR